ncbi:hypothetical protein ACFLQ8_00655 [Candidatus Auribacterota bacterium]
MTAGKTKHFYAFGTYKDADLKTADLTNESEWTPGPGLKKTGNGLFEALRPGKYAIKARFQTGDKWVSDSVEVNVIEASK